MIYYNWWSLAASTSTVIFVMSLCLCLSISVSFISPKRPSLNNLCLIVICLTLFKFINNKIHIDHTKATTLHLWVLFRKHQSSETLLGWNVVVIGSTVVFFLLLIFFLLFICLLRRIRGLLLTTAFFIISSFSSSSFLFLIREFFSFPMLSFKSSITSSSSEVFTGFLRIFFRLSLVTSARKGEGVDEGRRSWKPSHPKSWGYSILYKRFGIMGTEVWNVCWLCLPKSFNNFYFKFQFLLPTYKYVTNDEKNLWWRHHPTMT